MEEDDQQKGFVFQFKQQIMKAWQPIPTLNKTIVLFTVLGSIFLIVGIILQVYSQKIIEYSFRYDTCSSTCNQTITITSDMTGPIFVYYQLHNFYQNHRLYVKSLSLSQLQGNSLSVGSISTDCDPIVRNSDLYVTTAIDNITTLNQSGPANPCGLIAYTIFNDSFVLTAPNATNISISSTGIAWPSDLNRYKLGNISQMWYNVTDERFMIWMRIAALPNFRKLWGRIDQTLPAGNYTVQINNIYNVTSLNVLKYFVISQSNAFGSRNQFLSISYLVVGSICIVIAILFGIKKLKKNQEQKKDK